MSNHTYYQNLLSNGVVEVRCLDKVSSLFQKKKRTVVWSSTFDNWKDMRQSLIYAEKNAWDVYVTINPLKIPATNDRLKPFQRTAKDTDVGGLNTIFFDFDPVEKTEDGCSDGDVRLSLARAMKTAEFLDDEGWSMPTVAMSGNGAHLMYNVSMPVGMSNKFAGLYAGLARRFTCDRIGFDVSVKNPGRISRAYGTTNQKGGRKSYCTFSPDVTPQGIIEASIEKLTPPKRVSTWTPRQGDDGKDGEYIKNWDIVGVFRAAGLYLDETNDEGKHFVECLWAANHSFTGSTDTVIFEGEWAQYHCSHNSCADKTITDVIKSLGDNT
ncbi:MAG: hypothetical protein DRQ42_09915 [Gammaproteobacteria bacterium]|nr:MAG: hypothetical protein DRQ42_09915 [Gammaproteobacteria bacterium]